MAIPTQSEQPGLARLLLLATGALPALLTALALVLFGEAGESGGVWRVAGVLTAILFPGLLVAPLTARLHPNKPADPTVFGLKAYGLTIVLHILNVTLAKLAFGEAEAWAVLALGGLEALAAVVAWWRSPPTFHGFTRSGTVGSVICVALVAAWAVGDRSYIAKDLEAWYYHPAPMEWGYEGVQFAEADVVYEPPAVSGAEGLSELSARNGGPEPVDLRLFYVLKGPIGAELDLHCGDAGDVDGQIQKDVVEVEEEGPVARYQDRGAVAVSLHTSLKAGSSVSCSLAVRGGDPGSEVVDFVGAADWQVHEQSPEHGIQLVHYYQILNIVENVRWAEEVLSSRWLTINQPPLWSYVYSAVILYGGSHLVAINVYFYLLILAMALVGFRVVRLAEPRVSPVFAVPVALLALSHAKIITTSGSANFPDNLYAFAILSAFLGLAGGGRSLYIGAGLAATFLRYPGSTVVALAAALMALVDASRRKESLKSLGLFVGVLLVPCVVLALGALATGQLGHWLDILWFETFPEHFHGQYELDVLMARPPEFYGLWLKYAGFTPLLFLGLRGRLAKSAASLAVVYSFFLCFIDHFPTHYFLPLLALTGVAVTASLAKWPKVLSYLGLTAACGGLGWWLLWGIP